MYGTFQLPIGPGQLFFDNGSGLMARVLEGWRLSWTYNLFSGAPASIDAQPMLYNTSLDNPGATPGDWTLDGSLSLSNPGRQDTAAPL